MTAAPDHAGGGPSHRRVEFGVAVAIAVFAVVVMAGSLKIGITWGIEGPRAGFFPFYVGLLLLVASVVNGYRVLARAGQGGRFATWSELRSVMKVAVPTAVYVLLVPHLGIYLASALLIGLFMRWLDRYRWWLTLTVAIGVPLALFVTFERWFLLPLPKGPIEALLGF
jgi:putative tricarboxylic transport membrane protein